MVTQQREWLGCVGWDLVVDHFDGEAVVEGVAGLLQRQLLQAHAEEGFGLGYGDGERAAGGGDYGNG